MGPPPPPPPHFRHLKSVLPLLLLLFIAPSLSQSVIRDLPGFQGKLPFRLETGYIGVGEGEVAQLFCYFVESEGNPEYDPLFIWLTGGPGCSGLSGLLYEIGPLTFDFANSDSNRPSLILNHYSWTKVVNIIFIDQPVGTGYSYSRTPEGYNSSDKLAGAYTYEFLKKWLISHPKYLSNPLYITGDSYSGIILPIVVDEVYQGIDVGSKPLLNMKGYILGNPLTDVYGDFNGRIDFAYRMGLLADDLYQSAKENCKGYYLYVDPQNVLCQNDVKKLNECLDHIRVAHILEPWCDPKLHEQHIITYGQILGYHSDSWCRDDNYRYIYNWANNKSVQEALTFGTITEWVRCNSTLKYEFDYNQTISYTFDVKNVVNYHKKFTHKNCRAQIYSGDHDMVVPHTRTEEWIDSLKLLVQSEWRPWFLEGQIAGYTTAYIHGDYELVYATVKGAGHTAPEYKPQECLSMMKRWLRGSPL